MGLVLLGLYIIPETGIVWDDPIQRGYGLIVYDYIFGSNPFLLSYKDRFYGPFFEFILILGEKILGLKATSSVYIYRHVMGYVFYLIGVFFFYLLTLKLFSFGSKKTDKLFACFLSCVFVLTPRVFGHSFMNTKDIPFMVMFLISIYFLLHFIEKPSVNRAVCLGIVTGILIDIRVIGFFVLGIMGSTSASRLIGDLFSKGIKHVLISIKKCLLNTVCFKHVNLRFTRHVCWVGCFFVSLFITIYLFWPTLWENPFLIFDAVTEMSRFPWNGDVLFMGKYVNSNELPWTYLLVWIGITIPVLTLIMAVTGLIVQISDSSNWTKVSFQVLFLWIVLPLGIIVGKGAVLYDDWRHAYFLYPVIILFSGFGFAYFYSKLDGVRIGFIDMKKASLYFCLFYFGVIGWQLIKDREYSYVSFNSFAYAWGSQIGDNFELDYWGLSYKELLEYIVEEGVDTHKRTVIRLISDNYPGEINSLMFSKEVQLKLNYVKDLREMDYFMTNFRWRKGQLNGNDVYSVILDNGLKLGSVYTYND
ncbi:hypothetical protein HOH45_01360 [bacterium]|jgi:hypothetical protein|nr:hypothetical protein [bacterium]